MELGRWLCGASTAGIYHLSLVSSRWTQMPSAVRDNSIGRAICQVETNRPAESSPVGSLADLRDWSGTALCSRHTGKMLSPLMDSMCLRSQAARKSRLVKYRLAKSIVKLVRAALCARKAESRFWKSVRWHRRTKAMEQRLALKKPS